MVYFISTILAYFNIDVRICNYIGGMSIIPLIFLYISSFVFKFCAYHRIWLDYIVIETAITVYDNYIGIPISNFNYLILHCSLVFLIFCIATYFYVYRCN